VSDTAELLAAAERWYSSGEVDAAVVLHGGDDSVHELVRGVAFIFSFSNVVALRTRNALVLVDTADQNHAFQVRDGLRRWSELRVDTIIFSHGHIDHVSGAPLFDDEADSRGLPRPTVIAQAGVPRRFARYVETARYNSIINRRQSTYAGFSWPDTFRQPDRTYHDALQLEVDGLRIELNAARGETDDHTWVWLPEHRVVCCGDLFMWVVPNAGNPQKVPRYAREWADALRAMATLDADLLLPGHGLPVVGAERVHRVCSDTAELLEALHDQTVAGMNAGLRLSEIVRSVTVPSHLRELPYLQPLFDEPEFIVRNVWRLYAGWWDANPASLKPPSDAEVAVEVAALAGGATRLASRAGELAAAGELRLACYLIEMASLAEPSDGSTHRLRAEIYLRRQAAEASAMARGIFRAAADESLGALEKIESVESRS
jgi:alkyl sulfatase BDS1-like metallo-beta-lactamase superfamily hydrolase